MRSHNLIQCFKAILKSNPLKLTNHKMPTNDPYPIPQKPKLKQ